MHSEPYRGETLQSADPSRVVFVCQSKADADVLSSLDCLATYAPSWANGISGGLWNRVVVAIAPDDEAGRDFAYSTHACLAANAKNFRYLLMGSVPDGRSVGEVLTLLDKGDARKVLKGLVTPLLENPQEPPQTPYIEPEPEDEPAPSREPWVQPMGSYEDVVAWPEPLDLFRKSTLPPMVKDYCPPELIDYVWDQSDLMGSEPDILALCCLVAVSACLHDGIKIQPKVWDDGWSESGRLWGAFVGDPSIKKTPTMAKAVGHLHEIDINLSHANDADQGRYAEELESYKRALKASAKNGQSAGEKPKAPPNRRLIIEDFTAEAMGGLLKDNERGMYAQFDELGLFFGQMDAYRQSGQSKDRSLWLRAYNGGSHRIDRVGSGSVFVPNWSMRVLGGIQPTAIQTIAAKLPEDGLLQRFMIVMAQASDKDDEDRIPDKVARAGYRKLLQDIFAMQPSDERVRFSDEAQEVRKAFEIERKAMIGLAALPGGLTVALGKWDGLFCRLSLVHHAIHCATRSVHPVNVPVSADIARRVSGYLMEYMLFHGVAFYGDVLRGNDRAEHAKWIAGYIAAKPELTSIGSRDIARAYSKWANLPEWAQRDTMRILEDAAWVTPAKMTGRRTTQWQVNPKCAVTFADIGGEMARERLRRREALVRAAVARKCEEQ